MSDVSEQLKARTMKFALDCCGLIRDLPTSEPGPTARRQLAKSSTGLAFNYRASCRARSHAEFTAKTGVVVEEADESLGWLEFIDACGTAHVGTIAGFDGGGARTRSYFLVLIRHCAVERTPSLKSRRHWPTNQ
jgi:four helix bundle protein